MKTFIHGIPAERIPLYRKEVLHHLRGLREAHHRDRLCETEGCAKAWMTQQFNARGLEHVPEMGVDVANEFCNRTAPFYIMRHGYVAGENRVGIVEAVLELFLILLQNYLYKQWFRPYQSDIEYRQFIGHIIVTKPTPLPDQTCSKSMVDLVRRLHANTCARVNKAQDAAKGLADYAHDPDEQSRRLSWYGHYSQAPAATVIREQDFFILQPLFRAIAVVIKLDTEDLSKGWIRGTGDVKSTSVLIIRTGVEHGLSSPIIFDSITEEQRTGVLFGEDGALSAVEITLETAVTFLLMLEQR